MRQRAIYWLFPLIALAVAVFISYFLIQINPSAPKVSLSDVDEVLPPKESSSENNWLKGVIGDNDKEYFYPVNEVDIRLDTPETPISQDSNQSAN